MSLLHQTIEWKRSEAILLMKKCKQWWHCFIKLPSEYHERYLSMECEKKRMNRMLHFLPSIPWTTTLFEDQERKLLHITLQYMYKHSCLLNLSLNTNCCLIRSFFFSLSLRVASARLNWWPVLRDSSYYALTVFVLILVKIMEFGKGFMFLHFFYLFSCHHLSSCHVADRFFYSFAYSAYTTEKLAHLSLL